MDISQALSVVGLVLLVWITIFFQFPTIIWSILIGIGLVAFSIFSSTHFLWLGFFWIFYLLAISFANLHSLRQRYIIKPALSTLKQKIPKISATEREAIEAGDTWWEKELFSGKPHWKQLFSIPAPKLTEEEELFLGFD